MVNIYIIISNVSASLPGTLISVIVSTKSEVLEFRKKKLIPNNPIGFTTGFTMLVRSYIKIVNAIMRQYWYDLIVALPPLFYVTGKQHDTYSKLINLTTSICCNILKRTSRRNRLPQWNIPLFMWARLAALFFFYSFSKLKGKRIEKSYC